MRSVNKVILIGNLTRDPEMRQTPSGQFVTTFSIATNRDWVTKDGGKNTLTEYHDLVAWAKLAEICNQYLKKGKLVYVEGYLKTRSFETQEGIKKFKTEVVVQDMIMLDKKASNDNSDYIPEEEIQLEKEEIPEKPKKPKDKPVKSEPEQRADKQIDIEDDLGL